MGAYILRRLALVIPHVVGDQMIIQLSRFAADLCPVARSMQIIAQVGRDRGDVFEGFAQRRPAMRVASSAGADQ